MESNFSKDSSSASVSEPESGRALKIWPNPVSGLLRLQLPGGESEVEGVVVSDMLGRVMLRKDRVTASGLDVSTLPAGMYLLKLSTAAGQAYTGKFVKERYLPCGSKFCVHPENGIQKMRIFAASVSGQNSSEGIAVCPGMKKTYENISYSEYGTTGRYQGAA